MRWDRKGDHPFAVRLKPRAHGQEAPALQHWPSSSSRDPQGVGGPCGTEGQGRESPVEGWGANSNVLMVCSTGLKGSMINESKAMEEPESE